MDCHVSGPEEGDHLVCILGWGNRVHHEPVEWLIDQFVDAGYRLHAFEIPDVVTDFARQYVDPIQRYVEDLGEFRLVGHSTGGLIGAFVNGAMTRTYLSPWWGFPDDGGPGLSLAMKLPIERPLLPAGTTKKALGAYATDRQLAEIPSKAAPTFLREADWAHRNRPPIDDDAVVFCSLRDEIVGVRAIGRAVPSKRVVLYDGGHELFASKSRVDHVDTLLSVIESGSAGLSS